MFYYQERHSAFIHFWHSDGKGYGHSELVNIAVFPPRGFLLGADTERVNWQFPATVTSPQPRFGASVMVTPFSTMAR